MEDPSRLLRHDAWSDPLLRACLDQAIAWHGQQTRRDGATPYWTHPARVAMKLWDTGVRDVDVLRAGILHDVVEDTPTKLPEVVRAFGPRTGALVDALSKDPAAKRRDYTESFRAADPWACVVKLADRLDNVQDWNAMPAGYHRTYAAESLQVVALCWLNRKPRSPACQEALDRLGHELLQAAATLHRRAPDASRDAPA